MLLYACLVWVFKTHLCCFLQQCDWMFLLPWRSSSFCPLLVTHSCLSMEWLEELCFHSFTNLTLSLSTVALFAHCYSHTAACPCAYTILYTPTHSLLPLPPPRCMTGGALLSFFHLPVPLTQLGDSCLLCFGYLLLEIGEILPNNASPCSEHAHVIYWARVHNTSIEEGLAQ